VAVKGWKLTLVAALLAPSALPAQTLADYDYENLQFRGIGADFGWVWPTQIEPTISVGVRADLGYVGPHVRILPAARFWSSKLKQSEVDRLASQIIKVCERQAGVVCPVALDLGEIRRSDLALSTDAHYVFDPQGPVVPYAGGGLSLHLLNGRGELIDGTFIEDLLDTVVPGLDLTGGLEVPVGGAVRLSGEARFVLTSDVKYVGIILGGMWTLPVPTAGPAPVR
jgi:hypothetical protein